jgi:hypothetical protein
MPKPHKIGRRLFTAGVERDVFEDDDGRQYVIDDDKKRVHGQWLLPADEPWVGCRGQCRVGC